MTTKKTKRCRNKIYLEFSFDDGYYLDIDMAKMLERYNFRATFYIAPKYSKYMPMLTIEEMKELLTNGHTIGNHTYSHELLTRIPLTEVKEQINGGKEFLEDVLGRAVNKFSYPRGYYNTDIRHLVQSSGHTSARTVGVGNIKKPEGRYVFEEKTTAHLYPNRVEYGGLDWFSYAKNKIDDVFLGKGNYLHFWGHTHEIEKFNLWEDFDQLLQYISVLINNHKKQYEIILG